MFEDQFRQCLVELDLDLAVKLWKHVHPEQPPLANRHDALVALHMARTAAETIPLKLRAYSHRYLVDSGYPSQLPDSLKSRAERLYPKAEKSVGISVNSKYPVVQAAIHGVMQNAVLEAYADGHQDDPETVKKRMQEARLREQKGLML